MEECFFPMLAPKLALALATLEDALNFNPLFCPFFNPTGDRSAPRQPSVWLVELYRLICHL